MFPHPAWVARAPTVGYELGVEVQAAMACDPHRVTGGELFEDIVAREYYSEADAR